MEMTPTRYVVFEGMKIRCVAQTVPEGKLAVKELKLKKKEYGLLKREVMAQQKEIRAAYTHKVRTRGSMVRGGGGLGRLFRVFQTASRDGARASLAKQLAPLEAERNRIENIIGGIDNLIVQIESALLTA